MRFGSQKILLIVILFLFAGITSFYGQIRSRCSVKIFAENSKKELPEIRSFFTTSDLLISRILPRKRCADLSYSVVLIEARKFKKFAILSQGENQLRIYLSDDLSSWQNNSKLFSDIIAAAILKKSATSNGENFNVIPKWICHGILRKVERRHNRDNIPGTIAYPGIHALVLSGSKIDWEKIVSTQLMVNDKNAYDIFQEGSEIILDSVLRLPNGKQVILDIIELSNKGIDPKDVFTRVITKKLYDMKSTMAFHSDGSLNEAALDDWLKYNFKISSVNTFIPCGPTEAEKLFLQAEFVSYYAKSNDDKGASPEERFCKIEELPDKLDEIKELNSVILKKQRDLVRVAFGIPIPLQEPVYKMQKSMNLLLNGQKERFLKKYTAEKKRFFYELEKVNKLEQYMQSVEKEFVPPGFRYYAGIDAFKEMKTIKRKRWPALTELLDQSE
jgi:hypothetical protein